MYATKYEVLIVNTIMLKADKRTYICLKSPKDVHSLLVKQCCHH